MASNLEIIEELCGICDAQNAIIKAQADALAQVGAAVMEDERAAAAARFTALIGRDEIPDDAETLAAQIPDRSETDG